MFVVFGAVKLFITPAATDWKGWAAGRVHRGSPDRLSSQVMILFPTPTVAAATGGQRSRSGARRGEKLLGGIAMKLFPTPKASDGPKGSVNQKHSDGSPSLPPAAIRLAGSPVDWGEYGPAVARWEEITGRAAPAPTETGTKGQPRLSARFVEWLMGVEPGFVTGMDISRAAQLRLLGNGVVPQQAALALRVLVARLVRQD